MGKFACLPSLLAGESIRFAAAAQKPHFSGSQCRWSSSSVESCGPSGTKLGPRTTDASSSRTEQLMDTQPLQHAEGIAGPLSCYHGGQSNTSSL